MTARFYRTANRARVGLPLEIEAAANAETAWDEIASALDGLLDQCEVGSGVHEIVKAEYDRALANLQEHSETLHDLQQRQSVLDGTKGR